MCGWSKPSVGDERQAPNLFHPTAVERNCQTLPIANACETFVDLVSNGGSYATGQVALPTNLSNSFLSPLFNDNVSLASDLTCLHQAYWTHQKKRIDPGSLTSVQFLETFLASSVKLQAKAPMDMRLIDEKEHRFDSVVDRTDTTVRTPPRLKDHLGPS